MHLQAAHFHAMPRCTSFRRLMGMSLVLILHGSSFFTPLALASSSLMAKLSGSGPPMLTPHCCHHGRGLRVLSRRKIFMPLIFFVFLAAHFLAAHFRARFFFFSPRFLFCLRR
jgi:hypothetical protein